MGGNRPDVEHDPHGGPLFGPDDAGENLLAGPGPLFVIEQAGDAFVGGSRRRPATATPTGRA